MANFNDGDFRTIPLSLLKCKRPRAKELYLYLIANLDILTGIVTLDTSKLIKVLNLRTMPLVKFQSEIISDLAEIQENTDWKIDLYLLNDIEILINMIGSDGCYRV